ncbi:geranylgeranyl transferase type-2 subunit alpha isoform X2 [Anabrus simplex]|uniref:geranylgeranyl transferase type-2 subunit alpha isoform X2 n=1 Tax=Anabrus simplex TaxID=316456 RepID=UPI0034DD5EA6
MHGRVKTRTTAEQQEVKRKEREKKVKLYRAGIEKLFKKREDGLLDEEILEISGQLLSANPDIYTLWNLRREVVLHLGEQRGEDDVQQLMEIELRLTEQCLRANPKSYGAWHHRAWVLNTMPKPDWKRELVLCNKYLELDERNFHTWDYRNFVVQRSKVPAEEEYAYSTLKITTNFSNYSSWHYRSRLLPVVYPDPHNKRPIREDKHKEELELVQNAAFTDPNDQSAWFYQRWLLGRAYQPLALSQAFVSRRLICVALNQSVRLGGDDKASPQLELQVANQPVTGTWVAGNGQLNSRVWIFLPTCELFQGDGLSGSVVINLYCKGLADSMVLKEGSSGEEFWGYKKAQFGAQFSEILTYVLEDELQSCLQLMDLEPDSKWTLLTTVLLMQAIDRHRYKEETMIMLSQLISVDPLRTGYYKDLNPSTSISSVIWNSHRSFSVSLNQFGLVFFLLLLLLYFV